MQIVNSSFDFEKIGETPLVFRVSKNYPNELHNLTFTWSEVKDVPGLFRFSNGNYSGGGVWNAL